MTDFEIESLVIILQKKTKKKKMAMMSSKLAPTMISTILTAMKTTLRKLRKVK